MGAKVNKALYWAVVAIILLLPTIMTMVSAQEQTTNEGAPLADKELRSNERVGSKTDDEVVAREEEQINPDGLSVAELKILENRAVKHAFQAEINQLMHILINSLYTNSEIFLRELISNASDALDKIRFLSLTDKNELASGSKLEIRIKADKENKTLTISDTGIGMTKQDLITNLGTIAKSGTVEFLNSFKQAEGDASLIGQFGVGFYSAFLAADTVTVISKNNNDTQYVWQSDAKGSFSIIEDPRGDTLGRGTQIVLQVKEEAEEFLEEQALEFIVMKYSEFITFPIYLWKSKKVTKEVPLTEEEIAAEKASKGEEDSEEIKIDGEDEVKTEEEPKEEAPKTKSVTETVHEWVLMNEVKPIWTRSPKDLTDEEYNNFYKAFSKDAEDPFLHVHFLAEGEVEFKSLLYIPNTPPKNMFELKKEAFHRGLKLYVRRVFITDEFADILPKYLNFLKGVIDSDDLPLNVSREQLQESKTLKVIKKKVVRKAIAMLQELLDREDKSKYFDFWKKYGQSIKLGVIEDSQNRQRLSQLLLFHSSKTNELASLQDYVGRMKEGQKNMFFLAGESVDQLKTSPLAERLIRKGYEVLFMVDPIDEYAVGQMEKFDGKYKLINVAKEGVDLGDDDKERFEQLKKDFEPLTNWLKKRFTTNVNKAVVSPRLVTSPVALVSSQYGMTATMEKVQRAQTLGDNTYTPPSSRIMEINPDHPLIQELKTRVEANSEDAVAGDIADILYDTAALQSGYNVQDVNGFAKKVLKVLSLGFNLPNPEMPEPAPEPEVVASEEASEKLPETLTTEDKDEL